MSGSSSCRKLNGAQRPCLAPFRRLTCSPRRSLRPVPACASLSKSEQLAQLQNYKSGLDKALQAAAADPTPAVAPPLPAADERDLPELSGGDLWSTIEAQPQGMLTVVMCYTNKCVPCKAAKPVLIDLVDSLEGAVDAYKFALSLANKEVALAMGVNSSPNFLMFKDGKLVETFRGGNKMEEVKRYIRRNK